MRRTALLTLLGLTACGDPAATEGELAGDAARRQLSDAGPGPDPDPTRDAGPDLRAPPPDAEPDPDADDTEWPEDAGWPEEDPPDAAPEPPPPPAPPPDFPDLPAYSHGECPLLGGGPDLASSLVEGFRSGDQIRNFRLLVPSDYDGTRPLPLIFAWHWLNASASSFVREAELESAVDQMQFIAVVPEALRNANGDKTYALSWPFAEIWGVEGEVTYFDDLLACVTEQLNVDHSRIYGIGVSAGALWLTYLATTDRANYFAAIEVLSGGLGDMLGVWRMEYQPQPRKYPAIVLWGGPTDWLALSFHEASMRLRDALLADDHFVIECTHTAGHAVPPVTPPPGDTRFRFLWRFMFDHPYGLGANESPYLTTGLPDVFPDWCRIAGR